MDDLTRQKAQDSIVPEKVIDLDKILEDNKSPENPDSKDSNSNSDDPDTQAGLDIKDDPDKKDDDPDKKDDDPDKKDDDPNIGDNLDKKDDPNKKDDPDKNKFDGLKPITDNDPDKKDDDPDKKDDDPVIKATDSGKVRELEGQVTELTDKLGNIEKDEFLQKFINHYNNGGDPRDFLEANTVNYDGKSDLEVLKAESDRKYDGLTPENKDRQFRKELKSKYGLDLGVEDQDEGDVLLANELIKREAEKARADVAKQRDEFKIAEPKEAPKPDTKEQEELAQQWVDTVMTDPDIQQIVKSGLVKVNFEEDGQAFGYEVADTKKFTESVTFDKAFFSLMKEEQEDGSLKTNLGKWARVVNYALDPDTFEQRMIAFGKNSAGEKRLREAKNTDGLLNSEQVKDGGEGDDIKTGLGKALLNASEQGLIK